MMVFKIFSLITIVLCTSLMGVLYGESLKRRLKQLKEIDRIMLTIANEISYLMTPLPEIFENLSKDNNQEFAELFRRMSIRIKHNDTFDVYHAYKSVREDMSKEFYFNQEDMVVIDSFFRNIGNNDVRGEQNAIEFSRNKMKKLIDDSEEKIKKECKLATSLTMAAGLVIVILII